MLGITSERFPRAGALGLAIIGGTRQLRHRDCRSGDGLAQRSLTARARCSPIWAILPVALIAIFGAIYLRDKAAGGYRVEKIRREAPVRAECSRYGA